MARCATWPARYENTLNYFRLKASIGKLMDEDLASLDKWLGPAPKYK